MDPKVVITISREYGSGGYSIGAKIAKELNIPFYDKDYIAALAREEPYLNEVNCEWLQKNGWLHQQSDRLRLFVRSGAGRLELAAVPEGVKCHLEASAEGVLRDHWSLCGFRAAEHGARPTGCSSRPAWHAGFVRSTKIRSCIMRISKKRRRISSPWTKARLLLQLLHRSDLGQGFQLRYVH